MIALAKLEWNRAARSTLTFGVFLATVPRYLKLTGTSATVAAVAGLGFIGFLAMSTLWQFRHIPPARAAVEKELAEIVAPPGAAITQHNSIYRWTYGNVGNYYQANLTYDQIRAYYDVELARLGWKFRKQIPLTSWGKDLGESQTLYCKGNHAVDIYFTGNAQLGYRYALNVSWGGDDCD